MPAAAAVDQRGMTPLDRALDYLERRRAGESSESWSRRTIMRHRATLREHGIDYADVPVRSIDAPTRETQQALDAFFAYVKRTQGTTAIVALGHGGAGSFAVMRPSAEG